MVKFGVVFNITQLWATRVWKCSKVSELWNKSATQRWSPYVLTKFGEVGSTRAWEPSVRRACPPHLKIARRSAVKVQGQEVKGQGHSMTTCAEIRKIINNSAGDCSISLKFCIDFDHVMLDVPQTFKVNRSKVKVTAWHNVSALKHYSIQAWISCLVQ